MQKRSQSFQQQLLKKLQQSLYYNELSLIQSPQLLSHFDNTKQLDYPSRQHKKLQNNIEQLLHASQGTTIKRINESREKYRELKGKIIDCMNGLANKKQLNLVQILQWKQTILTIFLNEYLHQISKECKQKSEILTYIWNTVFNIFDYLFSTIAKMNERDEKTYLESLLNNHTSYQSIIDGLKLKVSKKQEEIRRQGEFIKALVHNLRYKRKQINKLGKSLKLCTVKLNEFKDFYIDLQLEHIQLLAQNRDISKQNALSLLKRKQQLNHEKRREYKLKQSQRKLRFQIESEIQNENINEAAHVNKLNDELQSAFNKFYTEEKSIKKIEMGSQSLFENALDDFNVLIDDIPDTETIIDFKNNTVFMDAATDMDDFVRDIEEKEVQITFNDRYLQNMVSHAAVQTVQAKAKIKIFQQIGIQVNQIELKILKLNRVRVIDRSYLLNDYRQKDHRYKMQVYPYQSQKNPAIKSKQDLYLKSMREIHYYDNNKKTVELLDFQLESNLIDIETQTNDACILHFNHIPNKLRNVALQKEIYRYVERSRRLSIESNENEEAQDENPKPKKFKKLIKKSLRKNYLSNFVESSQFTQKTSPKSLHEKQNQSSSKLSSTRITRHQSSFKQINGFKKLKQQNMSEIKQSNFQYLMSKTKTDQQLLPKMPLRFWTRKDNGEQVSKDKQRFVHNINLSDKLLDKFNHNLQHTTQMKKLFLELEKMTEDLSNNRSIFELLENSIDQNMHILKEELRKMLNKKKNNRKLPISRQKALIKIISLVYTYAYHIYLNHEKPLINLIIPLFHYFKIGYGEIKKSDLYLRMLYFLSQTIAHKEENYIFSSFITFLGLNLDEQSKFKVSKESTCLYLKLLSSLAVNFKFPLNVELLYTNINLVDKKCREILLEDKYQLSIAEKVVERVRGKLSLLLNSDEQSAPASSENIEYREVEINVFKCCQYIIEELERIKGAVCESYSYLYDYFIQVEGLDKSMFHTYILKNLYLPTLEKTEKAEHFQLQLRDKANLSPPNYLYAVVSSFLQTNLTDFNKIYFLALSKFRIKDEFLYLSLNRRYASLLKYLHAHPQSFYIEDLLLNHLIREEGNLGREATNKKIMGLAYLQLVEVEANDLLCSILGTHLSQFYCQ